MRKEVLLTFLILGVLLLSTSGVLAADSIYDFTADTIMSTEIEEVSSNKILFHLYISDEFIEYNSDNSERVDTIHQETGVYVNAVDDSSIPLKLIHFAEGDVKNDSGEIEFEIDDLVEGKKYEFYVKWTFEYKGSFWTKSDNEEIVFRSSKIEFIPGSSGGGTTSSFDSNGEETEICPGDFDLGLLEVTVGGRRTSSKTSQIYYCAPDLTFKQVKSDGVSCSEDYECRNENCNSEGICGEETDEGEENNEQPTTGGTEICPGDFDLGLLEVTVGGRRMSSKTSQIYYCAPDLTFKQVKSDGVSCSEDYECRNENCNSEGICGEETDEGEDEDGEDGLPKSTSCIDTDDAINQYVGGKVTYDGESYLDSCVDDSVLKEYFCSDGEKASREITCPGGYSCVDSDEGAACVPEGGSGIGCGPNKDIGLSNGAPFYTRHTHRGTTYYCALEGNWKETKDEKRTCDNNEECKSNVCMDGECYSVKKELESQTDLIARIYCIVTNLQNYLSDTEKTEYNSCLEGFADEGMVETGLECVGTPLACDSLFLEKNPQDCPNQDGCEWSEAGPTIGGCTGTATPCGEISVSKCSRQHGCSLRKVLEYD